MSSRLVDLGPGKHPLSFDHGVQFFTAASQEFRGVVSEWVKLGECCLVGVEGLGGRWVVVVCGGGGGGGWTLP